MSIPRRSGMSLVETLCAITVMGVAAIMYGSAWNANFGANDSARTIELATELYVREVALLRRLDPKLNRASGGAFNEDAFQNTSGIYPGACPPAFPGLNQNGTTFYANVGLSNELSYNTPLDKLLDTPGANCMEILPGTTWNPALPTDPITGMSLSAVGQNFAVRVFASRVQSATANGLPRPVAALNGTYAPRAESAHWLNQLVRYRVIVTRNNRHVVSGEILQEVR